MKKMVFVTKNLNKVADAQKLLSDFEIEHVDFDIPEIQSLDPEEIIRHKLEYAYSRVQKPCFVVDASLFLDCLGGFPGPFIKWWFENTVGEEKTCQIVKLFNEPGCSWVNTLGYYDGNDSHFFKETTKGKISDTPRGSNGYHWDTIFIPENSEKTLAEMTFEEKHSYSATRQLVNRFKKLIS